jgi:hypothetical protein
MDAGKYGSGHVMGGAGEILLSIVSHIDTISFFSYTTLLILKLGRRIPLRGIRFHSIVITAHQQNPVFRGVFLDKIMRIAVSQPLTVG